jgi:ABC-type polysaccharide/polyol phosphate transport system ATPase subunit
MLRDGELVAHRVWKRFRPTMLGRKLSAHLKHLPKRLAGERPTWMWALREVDFRVEPGEAVGLVGANGSGKSTLLKILNQVMYPFAGSVEVKGRTGALIEVATGLHPELSGRENVMLYGSLLGLKRRDIAARFDDIVQFAELSDAIDRQLKFYSSGMRMRLGFAVAAFLEPDVLLVDEVLAVGDARFQQRCLDRMSEVHRQGTTVVYVSHDLQTVEAACTRGIWLEDGVVMRDGPVRDVLGEYRQSVEHDTEFAPVAGTVEVVDVQVGGVDDKPPTSSEPLEVTITLSSPISVTADLHLGITEGVATPVVLVSHRCEIDEGKTRITCKIASIPVPRGHYFLWLAIAAIERRQHRLLPWGPIARFDVGGPVLAPGPPGVVRLAPVFVDTDWEEG